MDQGLDLGPSVVGVIHDGVAFEEWHWRDIVSFDMAEEVHYTNAVEWSGVYVQVFRADYGGGSGVKA